MFATPDWDDDNTKSSAKFAKKIKTKKTKMVPDLGVNNESNREETVPKIKSLKKGKGAKPQLMSVFQIPESKPSKRKQKPIGQAKSPNQNLNQISNVVKENKVKAVSVDYSGKATNGEFNERNGEVNKTKKIKKQSKPIIQKIETQREPIESLEHSHINIKTINGHDNTITENKKKDPRPKKVFEKTEKPKPESNTKSPKATKRKRPKNIEDNVDYSTDKPDELLLNMKKKKLTDSLEIDSSKDLLFKERLNPVKKVKSKKTKSAAPKVVQLTKAEKHKEQVKKVLQVVEKSSLRNPIRTKGAELRQKMMEKLKSAQFRYLNEKLYTTTGTEAQQLFELDPTAFQTYHEGYQQQIRKWPVNPLDVIVKRISKLPKSSLIADMGCGEGKLAQRLSTHTVRSFDLVAANPRVEACDMARTPLLASSVDAAVYCLALMGTGLTQYLAEANRVLKTGGLLLIAEVESRFDDPDAFAKEVQKLGFKLVKLDKSQNVFFFMEFKKMQECGKKQRAHLSLKPCYYKKR